jgi:hypothetical protein
MHRVVVVVRRTYFAPGLTSGRIVTIEQFVRLSTLGECLFPQGEVFPFLLQRRTP